MFSQQRKTEKNALQLKEGIQEKCKIFFNYFSSAFQKKILAYFKTSIARMIHRIEMLLYQAQPFKQKRSSIWEYKWEWNLQKELSKLCFWSAMQTPRSEGQNSDLVSKGVNQREHHRTYMREGTKPATTMTRLIWTTQKLLFCSYII